MAKLDILISGAGIAGPVLAYWLKRGTECSITTVELSPALRASGQNIDIRGAAVDVVRSMKLEDDIRSKNTTEAGVAFVDSEGNPKAKFPATGSVEGQSFTSEFEILRGDLAQIVFNASEGCSKYIFGEHITAVQQTDDGKVTVEFANDHPKTSFDIVIICDGMYSKTRRTVFGKGPDDNDYLKRLGQYCSYFTIPRESTDDDWARWYNASRGRLIFLRPDKYGTTRAHMAVTRSNLSKFDEAYKEGIDAQKRLLKEEFVDAGWQSQRVLASIDDAPDFYFQMTAQVKMSEFVKGNVALVGDAGYCPSPISGMGTSLAILGAYVLAGEISESPSDIPGALTRYQTVMKEVIGQCQSLVPGAPWIANPQTQLGISILNGLLGFFSSGWIRSLASSLAPATSKKHWNPPTYSLLQK